MYCSVTILLVSYYYDDCDITNLNFQYNELGPRHYGLELEVDTMYWQKVETLEIDTKQKVRSADWGMCLFIYELKQASFVML